jgi:flagellar FliL protein
MKPKRLILIILPVVLLLGGGGAAYHFVSSSKPSAPPEQTCQLDLPDLTLNLADEDRPHYLKTGVSLVIVGAAPEETLLERESQTRDAVIMVMTQHTYRELLSPEGKETLKSNIQTAVNAVLCEDGFEVRDVLFTEFIMD